MSAPRKRWDEHSARWRREAQRDGLSRSRWDGYFKLNPKTRRQTDQREYAKGETVAKQRRVKAETAAINAMRLAHPHGRNATMKRGIELMSMRELRWTSKASLLLLVVRAAQKPTNQRLRNPWWYR